MRRCLLVVRRLRLAVRGLLDLGLVEEHEILHLELNHLLALAGCRSLVLGRISGDELGNSVRLRQKLSAGGRLNGPLGVILRTGRALVGLLGRLGLGRVLRRLHLMTPRGTAPAERVVLRVG